MAKGFLCILLIFGWTIFGALPSESKALGAIKDFPTGNELVTDGFLESSHEEMKYLEIREIFAGKSTLILNHNSLTN